MPFDGCDEYSVDRTHIRGANPGGKFRCSGPGPTPEHFSGVISDYTPLNPNSGTNPTGPYEMRGRWSLHLKRDHKADFSAFMAMELSDYWVWHSNAHPTAPTIRGAHTYHIVLSDVAVTERPGISTNCPADSPASTPRFLISGTPTIITGNGSPAPFEAKGPSTLYVCVTGGTDVEYSNMTMCRSAQQLAIRRSTDPRRRSLLPQG